MRTQPAEDCRHHQQLSAPSSCCSKGRKFDYKFQEECVKTQNFSKLEMVRDRAAAERLNQKNQTKALAACGQCFCCCHNGLGGRANLNGIAENSGGKDNETSGNVRCGNIGRGFIGKTLSGKRIQVCFLDIVPKVIEAFNKDHEYRVRIVGTRTRLDTVKHVRAVDANTKEADPNHRGMRYHGECGGCE